MRMKLEYSTVKAGRMGLSVATIDCQSPRPTCVCIHGLGDGGFVWEPLVSDIAELCRPYLIDLRGHGDSSWADGAYLLDDYASDVASVLDGEKLAPCAIIGHSLGGAVAIECVRRQPQSVLCAVLVDAGPICDPDIDAYIRQQLIDGYRVFKSIDEQMRWTSERRPWLSPEVNLHLAERSLTKAEQGFRPKFDIRVAEVFSTDDEREDWWRTRLADCKVPAMIVRGGASAVLSKDMSAKMARWLNQGDVTTISAAGHAVMSDNPQALARAVKVFLSAQLMARTAL